MKQLLSVTIWKLQNFLRKLQDTFSPTMANVTIFVNLGHAKNATFLHVIHHMVSSKSNFFYSILENAARLTQVK